MSLVKRLEDEMKQALKAKDGVRVSCIRMLRSKLQEREVALRAKKGRDYGLDDDEAQQVVATYAKQRRDSIDSYRAGGREELAAAEEAELKIVEEYLPRQLGEAELRELVGQAVAESGASSMREMGAVMRVVMERVRGRADGALVSRLVREALSG